MKIVNRFIAIVFLMSLCNTTQAQWHDRNWVFGTGNLITLYDDTVIFKNINQNLGVINDVTFNDSIFFNLENVACISDSIGKLIFFNKDVYFFSETDTFKQTLIDYNLNEIETSNNGFGCSYSTTNGTIILPIDSINYLYVYLAGDIENNNTFNSKLTLRYHWIRKESEKWKYKISSKILFSDFNLTERVGAIKHPNGKDWWLIMQQSSTEQCTDSILSIQLSKDSIISINKQSLGIKRCSFINNVGEISISKDGSKIAMAYYSDSVEVFDFNRCTGLFSNAKLFLLDFNNLAAYGLAFSPNGDFLYINSEGRNGLGFGKLNQLNLSDNTLSDLFLETAIPYQMELGADNKIYFGYNGGFYSSDSIYFPDSRGFLHCIESPDSIGLACNLNLGKIKLNSSLWFYGLPNFPNYRLPALSIFVAEAGTNAVICTDDSAAQKIVSLGSPKINGVIYQWYPNYNLSSDTTAQPLAFPDSSTWYYVTLTDTTIQDACQSRTDSVLVEVRKCSVGIENATLKTYDYKIHPTLIGSELRGNITFQHDEDGDVELYNAIGSKVGV